MKPTDSIMCSGSRQMIALQSWSIKSRRKSTASSGYGGYCVIIKPFSFACVLKKMNVIFKSKQNKKSHCSQDCLNHTVFSTSFVFTDNKIIS